MADYFKHLCRRYEGEVALTWERVEWFSGPVPREKVLWHPQFGKKPAQMQALTALAAGGKNTPGKFFARDVDLLAVGSTMIVRFAPNARAGHWRLSGGGVITLMELFMKLGERYTAQELFCWYYHAQKIVTKRPHAWGSPDVRDAARLRYQIYNHWGHRRGNAAVGASSGSGGR